MSAISWSAARANKLNRQTVMIGKQQLKAGTMDWSVRKSPSKENFQLFLGDSPNAMITRSTKQECKHYASEFSAQMV